MSTKPSVYTMPENAQEAFCRNCGATLAYFYEQGGQCCGEADIDQRETTVLEAHLITEGFFITPLLMSQRRPVPGKYIATGMCILACLLLFGVCAGYWSMQKGAADADDGWARTTARSLPLFADSFQDNTQQWHLVHEAGKYDVRLERGSLMLIDRHNKLLSAILPTRKTYSNFRLVVEASLQQGEARNGYGVYIRGATDQSGTLATYYRLELYGDSSYAIFKGVLDRNGRARQLPERLIGHSAHRAIHGAGQFNQIEVSADGPLITFSVNGQRLKSLMDYTYHSGLIALFVSNIQDAQPGAAASFKDLKVFPIARH